MTAELEGSLDGEGLKIGIVVARFNKFITSRLLDGAKAALAQHGVRERDLTVAWVPGSFEIPVVAKKMAGSRRHDAVICLGAVIKGETDHYQHIASAAARGIADAGRESGVPVIFGVLTTDTVQQAVDRAGGEKGEFLDVPREASKPHGNVKNAGVTHGNAGYSAAVAAIETANLLRDLDSI